MAFTIAVALPPAPTAVLPADDPVPSGQQVATRPARSRRRALRWALIVALVAGDLALIVPNVETDGFSFAALHGDWLITAALAEAFSILLFTLLRARLLNAAGLHLPLHRVGALTLAATGVSYTVPAGTAVSAGYLYRQLRRHGGSAPVVAWAVVAGSVVSVLAFSVLAMAGTVLAGDGSLGAILGAGGLSLLAGPAIVAVLTVLTRHPRVVLRAGVRVLRAVPGARRIVADEQRVDRLATQLGAIQPGVRDWAAAFWCGFAAWAADFACFALCCTAVGVHGLGLGAAALAYAAGMAATSLSLLPGGLGSMEAAMLLGLGSAGISGSFAVAGVLAYRLLGYGLVACVGWLAWLHVRRAPASAGA